MPRGRAMIARRPWHVKAQPMTRILCGAITFAMAAALLHPAAAADKPAGEKPGKAGAKVGAKASRAKVLAVVNGQPITEVHLSRRFRLRQIDEKDQPRLRKQFLEELIDARLIQQFLASRKTQAPPREVEEQVERILGLAKSRGSDPEKAMAELGMTREMLREEFALPLAWKVHVDRAITAERVRSWFAEHRAEFDGTQVRARQILFKVDSEEESDWKAAETKLAELRAKIEKKEVSFEQAASEHSQAPSREEGGDVGWFPFSGGMPEPVSRKAFALKPGEMSQPIRSKFGLHLCLVTDRRPGELSLEDVRDEVLAQLSRELWKQTADGLRAKAKIEYPGP
jgi:parvulin-like peptidyl-prolyl isomerase